MLMNHTYNMSASNFHQPPSIHRSNAEIMRMNIPNQSSLKKYKVEIHLDQPLSSENYSQGSISHAYRPGDLISGELVLIPPTCSEKNEIKFNEITIQLDCKLLNNIGGGHKILFTMNDDPSNIPSALVSTTRFAFSFKLPQQLLDNTCPHNIELHKSLPPSFASPRVCSMVFSATQNAGVVPSECPQFDTYKTLPFNRFCVVYTITATIAQRLSSNGDCYTIFKRIIDLPVQNNLEPVPTNLLQTSNDAANHYSLSEINNDQNLIVSKSTSLKSQNKLSIGILTSSTALPPPVSLSLQAQPSPITLTLKFKPTIAPASPLLNLRYTADLVQYVIQSSGCIPPSANPQPIPENYHVENVGKIRKLVQKIQSVECLVKNEHEWIPDYEDVNILVKQLDVKLPYLGAAAKLQPTFHSCTLQNIYILELKVFNDDELKASGGSTDKSGSFLGKIGLQKSSCGSKGSRGRCIMKLEIPVTLLS